MSFSDTRLRVFHAVARHLSFTRAAEELYLTQPAITFQIRQLEEHFNTRLFDRNRNRIALTVAGQAVFEYADRILELYHETEKTIQGITGATSGRVTIGASTTVGEYLLPKILSGYHQLFPDVRLRMTVHNTSAVVRKLEDATIDIGMVEGPVNNANITVTPCITDELVVIVAPNSPLAKVQQLSLAHMEKFPFISREEGSGTRTVLEERLASMAFPYTRLNVVLELGSTEAIKTAVELGTGFGVVSSIALQKELQLQTLVVRRIQGMPLVRELNFIHQKQKFRSKAVEEFFLFSHSQCGKLKIAF